jgi:hypothetical protein
MTARLEVGHLNLQVPVIQLAYVRIVCIGMALVSLGASACVSESGYYCVFWGLSIALVSSMRWRNFSWSYAFLTGFFILGHWLKVTVHAVIEYRYVEPVGAFSGSESQWISYYQYAIVAMLAFLTARLLMVAMTGSRSNLDAVPNPSRRPSGSFWLIFTVAVLVFYTLNSVLGLFRTGMRAQFVLPFPFHAILSFLAFIGLAIVVAWYIGDELATRGSLRRGAWICLLIQGSAASVSMASRLVFSLHVVPVLLTLYLLQRRKTQGSVFKRTIVFAVILPTVLMAVSMYRVVEFYGGSPFDPEMLGKLAAESGQLFVDRWIGVEGMLTAVSGSQASLVTFTAMLVEDPNDNVFSIYQIASGSTYRYHDDRTFLTLPGAFAILAFSGSLSIVFFGTWLCVFLVRFLEVAAAALSQNRLPVVALVSCAAANAVTQLNFPWLLVPFAVQTLGLLTFMAIFSNWACSVSGACEAGVHEGIVPVRKDTLLPLSY